MQNKVTIESIIEKIKGETYIVMPDGRTTVCQLTLVNGYTINGTSACVDASNFDMNIGRKIAFEDALRQIWPLEGYLLAERLFWERAVPVATNPSPKPKKSRLRRSLERKPKKSRLAMTPAEKSAEAPYGLKMDGTPKKRPGRPAK
jgi:hypothetical protein